MYRISNRTNGLILLPDKRKLKKHESALVGHPLHPELFRMEQSNFISIQYYDPLTCHVNQCMYSMNIDALFEGREDFPFELKLPFNYLPNTDLVPYLKLKPYKPSTVVWSIEYYSISNGVVDENTLENRIKITNNRPITTKLKNIPGNTFYENTFISGRVVLNGSYKISPMKFMIQYKLKNAKETI